MSRVYNFSAGPSMLPEEVLNKAASEMLDYEGSGQSVMEMSHRSKVYDNIIKTAEKLLRELMNIPDNYKVLFLQRGASTQEYTRGEYAFGYENMREKSAAFLGRLKEKLARAEKYLGGENLSDVSRGELCARRDFLRGVITGEID